MPIYTAYEIPEPGDIFGKVSFNLYLSDEPEIKTYEEFFERYNDMLTDGEIIKIYENLDQVEIYLLNTKKSDFWGMRPKINAWRLMDNRKDKNVIAYLLTMKLEDYNNE